VDGLHHRADPALHRDPGGRGWLGRAATVLGRDDGGIFVLFPSSRKKKLLWAESLGPVYTTAYSTDDSRAPPQ
jgi:hypothetical protein